MPLTFSALKDDYADRWAAMQVRPSKASAVNAAARTVLRGKERYRSVSAMTGVPWHVIGLLHLMESGCGWGSHLHNGDSLKRRTVQVPKGRPVSGNPPFAWEESACDALTFDGLTAVSDWSIERTAFELEKFNGLGYRGKGIPSPYLWSYSDQYTAGKYVADGKWSATAVSQQPGAMPVLKALMQLDPSIEASGHEPEITPAQAPPPAPAEAPVVKGASRKWSIATWLKGLFGGTAVGASGYNALDSVQTTQTYLSVFKGFIAEWGVVLLITACVGGFILAQLIHHFMDEDAEAGRYVPSRSEQ